VTAQAQAPVRRRDSRYRFESEAVVEFLNDSGGLVRGHLLDISAAGLAFEIRTDAATLRAGSLIHDARVRVGECELHGTIAIKNVRAPAKDRTHVGCLFYPVSPAVEHALMSLLTGLGASGGESHERAPAPRRAV